MGFVKLSDNLQSWAWYGDNNTLLVYIRLLVGAVWHETEFQNVTLHKGQIATTLPKIAKENGITERQARTVLERLKSTGRVSVKTTSRDYQPSFARAVCMPRQFLTAQYLYPIRRNPHFS